MTEKQIKEMEPQALNSYVYSLVGCENGRRYFDNRFGAGSLNKEDDAHIPSVDYYRALEACKTTDTETHLKIKSAVEKAQRAFNEILDKEVGKELMQIISGL